ncbi:hypothetical protein OKW22_001419, partial [Bacilli bacterium PM5-3]|nr:hypothetical protein [Bacilli bacterium PM5-3]
MKKTIINAIKIFLLFVVIVLGNSFANGNDVNAASDLSSNAKATSIKLKKAGVDQETIWNGTTYDLVLEFSIALTGDVIKNGDTVTLPHNFASSFSNYTGTYDLKHNNVTNVGTIEITEDSIVISFNKNMEDLMLPEIASVVNTGQKVQPLGSIAEATPGYKEHTVTVGDSSNADVKSETFKYTKYPTADYDNFLRSIYKGGEDSIDTNKLNWTIAWNMDYAMSLTLDDGQNYLDTQSADNQIIIDPLPEGSTFVEENFKVTYGRLQYVKDGKRYYASSNDNGYDVTDLFARVYHNGIDDQDAFLAKLATKDHSYGVWKDPSTSEETLYVFMKNYGITTDELVKRVGYADLDDYIAKSDIPEELKASFKEDHTYNNQAFRTDINLTTLHSGVAGNTTFTNIGKRQYSYPDLKLFYSDTHTSTISYSGAVSKGAPYSLTLVNYDLYDSTISLKDSEFELYIKNGENWDLVDTYSTGSTGVMYTSGLAIGDYKLVHKKAPTGYDESKTIYKLNGSEITEFKVESSESEGRLIYAFTDQQKYEIKTSVVNGSITPTVYVSYDGNAIISYSPDANHIIKSVNVNGSEVNKNLYESAYSFSNVKSDQTIAVEYELKKYSITTSVVNGTIDATATVEHGDNKTINYAPTTGYKIKSVTVDGTAVDKTANASSYTFTNVTANHTIAVEYEINTYTITTSVVNGTIDATATVDYGDNKTINYAPTTGYKLKSVTVDGTAVDKTANASSYTFTNVTANHTIAVEYEIETYTITTSVVNGTIDATATVDYGDNKTINYAPTTGYKLKSVTVDGTAVDKTANASSYTFTNVTANHTIAVEYEIKTYTITTSVDNGTIDATATVDYGDNKTINYAPTTGYKLKSVTVDGTA